MPIASDAGSSYIKRVVPRQIPSSAMCDGIHSIIPNCQVLFQTMARPFFPRHPPICCFSGFILVHILVLIRNPCYAYRSPNLSHIQLHQTPTLPDTKSKKTRDEERHKASQKCKSMLERRSLSAGSSIGALLTTKKDPSR